jgi:hypothetical protein
MAQICIEPVGSATLIENFDTLVLRKRAREALKVISDRDLRELSRDYFLDQRFRRDVFGRDVATLSKSERHARLLGMPFSLLKPVDSIEFQLETAAGRVRFDNLAARRIVTRLAGESARLSDCLDTTITTADLIANALMLCSADVIGPSVASPYNTQTLNRALLALTRDADGAGYMALPCGTALRLSGPLLDAVRDRVSSEEERSWVQFLNSLSGEVD